MLPCQMAMEPAGISTGMASGFSFGPERPDSAGFGFRARLWLSGTMASAPDSFV